MRLKALFGLPLIISRFFLPSARPQQLQRHGEVVQGMNIPNPLWATVPEQDELISQLRKNGVHAVRCGITPGDGKGKIVYRCGQLTESGREALEPLQRR